MPEIETSETDPEATSGLTRAVRIKIYAWGGLALLLASAIWAWMYLRPERWYTYTDQVAVEKVARDVQPGYVLWDPAEAVSQGIDGTHVTGESVISSDGVRMVYTSGGSEGDANLFLRIWDGNTWGPPRPMRALNSKFHETSPAFSGDSQFLFFTSNRPGGQGGDDIWVSKWDGAEYAWPLPLTSRVNTPFDEIDPALAPDSLTLFFASNRPHQAADISEKEATEAAIAEQLADVDERKVDFDLYSADLAGDTLPDLIVERQLSMLYSLREGALADADVMAKLGGSASTEAAVDKALAYLASQQEEDGRWDISRTGGQRGHDVAATAFSLLAFYGRGERHDRACTYQEQVKRGLDWMLAQQNGASGDLRGSRPQQNAMYDHGIAALALVEAYGVTKDPALRPRAQASIDFIVESQHEEGGWRYRPGERGDLSVSGWMVMALASGEFSGIPIPAKTQAGVLDFLELVSGGKEGGSYGYTDGPGTGNSRKDAMNAVGFFCAQLTGASSNAARAFESGLILDQAGFKLADIYYAYYGTLAAYQNQGPVWRKWMKTMQAAFIEAQTPDGSWEHSGPHASAMGKAIGTALVALCLEAHYRYTPLYGLGFEPDPAGPNPHVLSGDALPTTPIFRHAKHLATLSSPGDDNAPVVTDHGDFLYFASNRAGGFGGFDIYRSRVTGKEPSVPVNPGGEINSRFNETHPAVRMAGFHLLFNSDREANVSGLYGSKSKRVLRLYDYSKRPSGAWLKGNIGWLIAALLAIILFATLTLRALRRPLLIPEEPELTSPAPSP